VEGYGSLRIALKLEDETALTFSVVEAVDAAPDLSPGATFDLDTSVLEIPLLRAEAEFYDVEMVLIPGGLLQLAVAKLVVLTGQEQYNSQCASCHGLDGTGAAVAVSLVNCANCSGQNVLSNYINNAMPLTAPENCVDSCASDVAYYILKVFSSTTTQDLPSPDGDDGTGDDDGDSSDSPLLAFPGCQGWGCDAVGGRGGQVIYVTNLNDSGPGSLREALTTPEPRTVLFKVSGVIDLLSPIEVGGERGEGNGAPFSNLTIAGQSAPGGGIALSNYGIELQNGVEDVIIRHIRFRGAQENGSFKQLGDAIEIGVAKYVVIDHVSVAWADHGGITAQKADVKEYITVQNSIIAEALTSDGKGINFSRGADHASVHHNLFMSNARRNPRFVGNNGSDDDGSRMDLGALHPQFEMYSNIIYNWLDTGASILLGAHVHLVENLFASVGAQPRDSVDQGLVDEFLSRSGGIISSRPPTPPPVSGFPATDSDSDGMPDDWETTHGFNLNVKDGSEDADGDGYTNLEEYLNDTDPG